MMPTSNSVIDTQTWRRLALAVGLLTFLTTVILIAIALGLLLGHNVRNKPAPINAAPSVPAGVLHITPVGGTGGTEIAVRGQGWRQGENIFIRLESEDGQMRSELVYGSAVVDETGHFEITFAFPAEERWLRRERVNIVAWVPATGARSVAPFDIIPSLATSTPLPTLTNTKGLPTIYHGFTLPAAPTFTATPTSALPTPTATPVPVTTSPAIITEPHERGKGRDAVEEDDEDDDDDAEHLPKVKFTGVIENRPSRRNGLWQIAGWPVIVSGQTQIDEDKGAAIVGAFVEVEGRQRPGGPVRAKKIKVEDE